MGLREGVAQRLPVGLDVVKDLLGLGVVVTSEIEGRWQFTWTGRERYTRVFSRCGYRGWFTWAGSGCVTGALNRVGCRE